MGGGEYLIYTVDIRARSAYINWYLDPSSGTYGYGKVKEESQNVL